MDERTKRVMMYDFYGALLTQKQREIYDLYYQQDLSLGEIAELHGVSRQAVFDLLKRTDEVLREYDNKLGLVAKYFSSVDIVEKVNGILAGVEKNAANVDLKDVYSLLNSLKSVW